MAAPSSLPCLVLDYGADRRPALVAASDGARRACDAEELRGTRIWPTSHGWVLAWDPATAATFLWNPRAPGEGGRLALPPLEQPPPAESACALSASPTGAGGFTVILFEPPDSTVLWYCHAGGAGAGTTSTTTAWTRHEYDLGGSSIRVPEGDLWCKRVVSRPVSCRGRFYYAHSPSLCGVIDFSSPTPAFSTVPVKKVKLRVPEGDIMAAASFYALEINGDLYTVYIFYHGIDFATVVGVGVYRMDLKRGKQLKVIDIGDRAILAGSGSQFGGWCPATRLGLLPNSVYWTNGSTCLASERERWKYESLARVLRNHHASHFGLFPASLNQLLYIISINFHLIE